MKRLFTPTLLALALTGTVGTALAQDYNPQQGQPSQQQPGNMGGAQAMDISSDQLEKFVTAEKEVQSIRQDYAEQLNDTQELEEAQTLQQQAQEEMVQAVQAEGLDVNTFNRIASAIQTDEALRARAQELY